MGRYTSSPETDEPNYYGLIEVLSGRLKFGLVL
jgi:hypothetical protein